MYRRVRVLVFSCCRSGEAQCSAIADCVSELRRARPAHYDNLRFLVHFLRSVVQQSDANKMSEKNLGICIGLNLIWPHSATGGTGASAVAPLHAGGSGGGAHDQSGVGPPILEALLHQPFDRVFPQTGASTSSRDFFPIILYYFWRARVRFPRFDLIDNSSASSLVRYIALHIREYKTVTYHNMLTIIAIEFS